LENLSVISWFKDYLDMLCRVISKNYKKKIITSLHQKFLLLLISGLLHKIWSKIVSLLSLGYLSFISLVFFILVIFFHVFVSFIFCTNSFFFSQFCICSFILIVFLFFYCLLSQYIILDCTIKSLIFLICYELFF
jgi:hypothetical protein